MSDHSGFVALLGRPNVGKSTLLNAVLDSKVAIASSKPETTRQRIRGIWNSPEGQLVLVDTPGIHRPRHRLGEHMVHVAQQAARDVDLIWHVVDLSRAPNEEDRWAADMIHRTRLPGWLIGNKTDQVEDLEARLALYRNFAPYEREFHVSAETGDGVAELRDAALDRLPEGPRFFPEDMVTDQAEDFYIAEVIREQVMELTRDEVPHAVAVVVEEKVRRRPDLIYIRATLYAERESQRSILIGEGGRMSREIGKRARAQLEEYFGHPVYLEIWVKAQNRWRDRDDWIRRLVPSADPRGQS
jgi:GTP-binding protein Era